MKLVIKIIVPLLILAAAYYLGGWLISKKEDPKSKKPPLVVPVVDVVSVSPDSYAPPVKSFGTVQSYFETSVVAQVSAVITAVSEDFRVGRKINKGDLLVILDDTDFQAELAGQQANLALQKRALAEEVILARQAKDDWVASGRSLQKASDFVLRKPQLAAAKANVKSAEADIQKAVADIERARLLAPFDAVVTERTASIGNFANAQSPLGTLVATEKAEIVLPLTAEQVDRVTMPYEDRQSIQEITLTNPQRPHLKWGAKLTRVAPTVNPQNQVTNVIAEIEKPYGSQKEPLSVGSFVNASIPGKKIEGVYKLPEAALVNDSFAWVLDSEMKLLRVSAERIHSFEGSVYVRVKAEGLNPPLKVVSRPLSNFRSGTIVRVNESEDKPLP